MVVINVGFTAPVNRADISPALTQAQVWAALERKVRHAHEFVPIILSCKVLSEHEGEAGELVVTREVVFAPGAGPKADGEPVREVCRHYAPCRVDFYQEDGSRISNLLTVGPSGKPDDLFLSYVFEWRHPDVEEGSPQAKDLEEKHRKTPKSAVEFSLEAMRRMVEEGRIA